MPPRLFARLMLLTLLAGALAGCGRKGPLELPPDVQAARNEKLAAQQAEAERRAGPRAKKLSEEGSKPKAEAVEGERGKRPPADYPFFLDPLL